MKLRDFHFVLIQYLTANNKRMNLKVLRGSIAEQTVPLIAFRPESDQRAIRVFVAAFLEVG